jgi:hypothetical protein
LALHVPGESRQATLQRLLVSIQFRGQDRTDFFVQIPKFVGGHQFEVFVFHIRLHSFLSVSMVRVGFDRIAAQLRSHR